MVRVFSVRAVHAEAEAGFGADWPATPILDEAAAQQTRSK